ncbi:hypothetical protein GGR53DRAFT_490467, partial [Hypoxylon sp. FL1150]
MYVVSRGVIIWLFNMIIPWPPRSILSRLGSTTFENWHSRLGLWYFIYVSLSFTARYLQLCMSCQASWQLSRTAQLIL